MRKDPNNPVAKRLLIQSFIHEGQSKLIDHADLTGSNFVALDLSGRRLEAMILKDAKIERLEAYNADLSRADLRNAKIGWSGLWHADLQGAKLEGADLGRMAIADANLNGIHGLKRIFSTDAAGASFEKADLNGTEVRVQQNSISFPLIPFYGDYLDIEDDQPKPKTGFVPKINFSHANLSHAQIRIDGLQIDFSGTDLTGAKFELTDFRGADITDAKLDGVRFTNSVYDCATKWPAGFSPNAAKLLPLPGLATCWRQVPLVYDGMDLHGLNFAGLNLRKSSFRKAYTAASVVQTRFIGADLSEADLRGADFREANLENAKLCNALYDRDTQWPKEFDPKKAGARYCASNGQDLC